MSTPSAFAKILAGLNGTFKDPQSAGLTGFAQGLLQASAPHMMTPVSMGQALGMGAQGAQQYQSAALQNAMMRETVPFQGMKVSAFAQALKAARDPKSSPAQKAAARALIANLVSPGMGPAMVANSPTIQGAKTNAISRNKPTPVGPGQRIFGPVGGQSVGAQGALPVGSSQGIPGTPGGPQLGSLNLSMLPGAAQAIQGAAANQSFGSSQGALPAQAALQQSAPHTLGPGTNLGSMNPPPAMAPNVARMVGAGMAQGAPPPVPPATAPGAAPPAGPGVRSGMSLSTATGQKVNQTQATTAMNADIEATKERQQRVANLEELNAVASGLQTGPGMDAHIAVLKALASIPGAVGIAARKLQTITNAQIFNKTALNLSLQTVSGAGQHAYDAFKSVMNAFPELSKTPLANAVVTGSLLATARYEADKSKFAANWQQSNGMGYVPGKGSYDAVWAKNANFMSYFLNALPPQARTELFQKAGTNATLRNEINQAVRSDAWLKSNGY